MKEIPNLNIKLKLNAITDGVEEGKRVTIDKLKLEKSNGKNLLNIYIKNVE